MAEVQEDILSEEGNRFVLFPIKYPDIYKMYKTAISAFWQVEEIDFSKDIQDWENKLSDNERFYIENVLAFFAASDGLVDENLVTRFYTEVKIPEARAFYTFQMAVESIHSECYSIMIDTFIKSPERRQVLFDAMHQIPAIKKKADWTIKWMEDQEASFAQRLVAFAVVEGIFFSSAFASIFWLQERNLMPGLCLSNSFINREEGLHVDFAVLLYTKLRNKMDVVVVQKLVKDAVDIEIEFVTESIPCSLLGMNNTLMAEYVKFVADRLMIQLGYDKIYDAKNSFPFMDRINLSNKTNFFEHTRLAEYSRSKVGQKDVFKFTTEADF
jgi:ribonucleoside-diphosphate reductase subunit M2